jgi:hypothetical protein
MYVCIHVGIYMCVEARKYAFACAMCVHQCVRMHYMHVCTLIILAFGRHECTSTHTRMCVYAYIHTQVHMYVCIFIHTCVHDTMCACIRAYVYVCMTVCLFLCWNFFQHCTPKCIHTYSHVYIYTSTVTRCLSHL